MLMKVSIVPAFTYADGVYATNLSVSVGACLFHLFALHLQLATLWQYAWLMRDERRVFGCALMTFIKHRFYADVHEMVNSRVPTVFGWQADHFVARTGGGSLSFQSIGRSSKIVRLSFGRLLTIIRFLLRQGKAAYDRFSLRLVLITFRKAVVECLCAETGRKSRSLAMPKVVACRANKVFSECGLRSVFFAVFNVWSFIQGLISFLFWLINKRHKILRETLYATHRVRGYWYQRCSNRNRLFNHIVSYCGSMSMIA